MHTPLRDRVKRAPGGNARLTRREVEVIVLIATGLRAKDVAEKLFVTERTINYHMQSVFIKYGVKNRVQALNKARALGVIGGEA